MDHDSMQRSILPIAAWPPSSAAEPPSGSSRDWAAVGKPTTTIVEQAPLAHRDRRQLLSEPGPDRARHLQARRARRRVHPRRHRAAQASRRSTSGAQEQRGQATGSGFVIDRGHDPHERPRGQRRAEDHVQFQNKQSTDREGPGHRRVHRPRAAQVNPAGQQLVRCAGLLQGRAGRRPADRDRQPVRPRAHAHHRRDLRGAAHASRRPTASRSTTSCRPTRRSTPATPAAR